MPNYRVTAHCLNVRRGPSLSSEVIAYLRKDDAVPLLEKSEDDYWFRIETPSGLRGWSSHKFLASTGQDGQIDANDPPWLKIAIRETGVKEYAEAADNPRIVEYHQTTTLGPRYASQDETPWCSSFVNWCFEKAGYEGSDSAMARSWLHWGKELATSQRGCVVIFSRPPNPASGHVGFYMGETDDRIRVLGGNQSNEVNVSGYRKNRLIGYRWPGIDV